MRISNNRLRQQAAICLLMLLTTSLGEAATASPQQTMQGQQPSAQVQPKGADSGSVKPGEASQSTASADNRQAGNPQTAPAQQQKGTRQPVGTAAAPYEKGIGVAASRPAGAAIAPAKQRRARSFLIKVGVLVGAGIAIGTVAALSKGSPSRPH